MNYGKTNATGTKVFFATNEKLTADDTDTSMDVYERSGGATTLLSKGTIGGNGPQDAFFAGSSSDGSQRVVRDSGAPDLGRHRLLPGRVRALSPATRR